MDAKHRKQPGASRRVSELCSDSAVDMLVTGRSGVYEVRRVDDILIFEEGMGSEFRFGELETEGGWMVGNLRCTSGESQGTIRLRLEGTSMTSQFKAPGENVWGSKLVAQRSQAGEGN